MISRLKTSYEKEIKENLMVKLSVKNKHEVEVSKDYFKYGSREDASDGKT